MAPNDASYRLTVILNSEKKNSVLAGVRGDLPMHSNYKAHGPPVLTKPSR